METLPRHKVLNFLKEGFKELAIPYLEHIVYVWEDQGPEFHNVLIQLYLERVQSLMKQYLNSLPEGGTFKKKNKKTNTWAVLHCLRASSQRRLEWGRAEEKEKFWSQYRSIRTTGSLGYMKQHTIHTVQ